MASVICARLLASRGLARSQLRPDIVLDFHDVDGCRRTAIVEVKLRSRAADAARASLFDSLAYTRETFRGAATGLWSIGTFWGVGQQPSRDSNVLLASLDCLGEALNIFLGDVA